jgi:hypothetical protein
MSTEHSKPAEFSWKVAAGNATVARPARPSDLAGVLKLFTAARLPVQGVEEGFGDGYAVVEHNGAIASAAGIEIYGRPGVASLRGHRPSQPRCRTCKIAPVRPIGPGLKAGV